MALPAVKLAKGHLFCCIWFGEGEAVENLRRSLILESCLLNQLCCEGWVSPDERRGRRGKLGTALWERHK